MTRRAPVDHPPFDRPPFARPQFDHPQFGHAGALRGTLWLGLLLVAGCVGSSTPTPNVAERADVPASAEPQAAPAATPPQPAKPGPDARQIPPVAEPVAPGANHGGTEPLFPVPPPVDVASIEKLTPGWELALPLERPVALERLDGGLLVRLAGKPHELGPDGALKARPAVDPSRVRVLAERDKILGVWPGDPWRIGELRFPGQPSDLSFHKWNGANRWVTQPFFKSPGIEEHELGAYRWTPRGGLLLVAAGHSDDKPAEFHRVGGSEEDPAPMQLPGDWYVRDAFESAGGTLFVFMIPKQLGGGGAGLRVFRRCKPDAAPGCERGGGLVLGRAEPDLNIYYITGVMAARQRWNISVALTEDIRRVSSRSYLVHYDDGDWKLDALPGEQKVVQLLPVADGGMWIVLADFHLKETLWHRSAAGKWVAVTLPERAADMQEVQLALRDADHVWLAVNSGDHHALYSTAAAPQATPANPPG